MDSRSRSNILLEERINQVDDFNLDALFETQDVVEEVSAPQEEQEISLDNITNIDLEEKLEAEPVFEMEVQPNEFLDNLSFQEEEKVENKKTHRLPVTNKPLFYALTSILALLGILFIYNLFVIGSLEVKAAAIAPTTTAATVQAMPENSYIMFDSGASLEIENYQITISSTPSQTNWFNNMVDDMGHLFGGNN